MPARNRARRWQPAKQRINPRTPKNASLISASFVVVKVDLGNFDRHLDISQRYGTPIQTGRSGGVADRQAATPRVPVSWRMRAR
ncbi:hypothetical protein ACQR5V_06850 [Xanthomonas oryzae pv. oryzicola]|uniref:hypothetical protein n=1 Tax=Xanthomonas oryzae TaxID=347 RepID=UPI000426E2AD|nr:hypothetical protein [Xanthomonas oryzae]MEC5080186.1 hypothetical protein [Xanthomonas oryzae pv. oryzicola]MEC5113268.1 hypothetical protein [Xanthomonas oryzae pv. oryzicola]WVN06874.1 hypothetical protein V1208_01390 [Xanthomonas oryzae pv. oryzicola]